MTFETGCHCHSLNNDPRTLPTNIDDAATTTNQMGMTHNPAVFYNDYATLRNRIFNQIQDPECDIAAFAGAGTVTDPAISPFHI